MASEQVISSHVTESQLKLIATESAWYLGYATLKGEQLEAVVTFFLWEMTASLLCQLDTENLLCIHYYCHYLKVSFLLFLLAQFYLMLAAFVILESKNSVTGTYCCVDTICSAPLKLKRVTSQANTDHVPDPFSAPTKQKQEKRSGYARLTRL